MAISVLQRKTTFKNNASSATLAFTSTLTAGSLLVAVCGGAGGMTFAVSDSLNGSYTLAVKSDSGNTSSEGQVAIFYFANSAGGSAPTVTFSGAGSGSDPHLHIIEVAGIVTTSPKDASGGTFTASGTSQTPTTTTSVSQSSEYVISAALDWGTATAFTVSGGGQTLYDTSNNTTGGDWMGSSDNTPSGTTGLSGTQSTTWSVGSNHTINAVIATFLASATTPSTTPNLRTLMGIGI